MGASHSQFDSAVADLKKCLSLLPDLDEPILWDSPLPVMTPSVKATDLAKPGQSPMLQRLPLEQLKAKIREGHRTMQNGLHPMAHRSFIVDPKFRTIV